MKYHPGVQSIFYKKVSGCLTGPGARRLRMSIRLGRRPSGSTELNDTDALLFCCNLQFYLIVVDHKTSTQITHFRLTFDRIILTYQLYYPLLHLQHLFLHCRILYLTPPKFCALPWLRWLFDIFLQRTIGSIPGQCIWDKV